MRFILFLLTLSFLVSACKKEKSPEPAPSSGGSTDGYASSSATYYGIFSARQLDILDPNNQLQTVPNPLSNVSFSSFPVGLMQNASPVEVDSVSLNNVRFRYDGSYYYEDTTYTTYAFPYTWKVDGRGVIPNINYENNTPFPAYTGYASLPDTIKNTMPLTFTLSGLSGYDKIMVMLSGGTAIVYSEPVGTGGSVNVTIPLSDMDDFDSHSQATLIVWLIKNNVRLFGGKAFNFTSEYLLGKDIAIK